MRGEEMRGQKRRAAVRASSRAFDRPSGDGEGRANRLGAGADMERDGGSAMRFSTPLPVRKPGEGSYFMARWHYDTDQPDWVHFQIPGVHDPFYIPTEALLRGRYQEEATRGVYVAPFGELLLEMEICIPWLSSEVFVPMLSVHRFCGQIEQAQIQVMGAPAVGSTIPEIWPDLAS